MRIAAFGDIHGRIGALYESVQRWENINGLKIDFILQAGDIGYFSDKSKIDSVTLKRSKKDTSELELYLALQNPRKLTRIQKGILAPLYFVDGNHDDQDGLERLTNEHSDQGLIEIANNIFYISSTSPIILEKYNEKVKLSGIGGIDSEDRPKAYAKDSRIAFTEEEIIKMTMCQNIDIILSHMPPAGAKNGSQLLKEAIEEIQPKYSFSGHRNQYTEFNIGPTQCFNLNKVEKENPHNNFSNGSMIVIEINKNGSKVITQP